MAIGGPLLLLTAPDSPQAGIPAHRRAADRALAKIPPASDGSDETRAKHFRFRADDGAQAFQEGALEASGDFTDQFSVRLATDWSGAEAGRAFLQADADREGKGSLASTAFLAQLIAQEVLPQGLHYPPARAADIAYRRAGAEPPLDDVALPPLLHRDMPLVRLSV
jgi:hypothetical protein